MTYELKDFDDIRPYNEDEVRGAVEELLQDEKFNSMMHTFIPWLPKWARNLAVHQALRNVKTTTDFQVCIVRYVIRLVMRRSVDALDMECGDLDRQGGRYTFISNHRDIVLDSAFLGMMLMENGFATTMQIAIGDNLIIHDWIRILVRLCKAFLVRRSLPPRELLRSSQKLSNYMHYVINEERDNIWIAQREGRAKDSSDNTQDAVLKMLAMGGEGTVVERLKALNIVPLTISYEYDPCDYLKAMEFQYKRDVPGWKKSKQDDLDNMRTGITGYKGRVHYHASSCINGWLDELADVPRTQIFTEVARRLDEDIHGGYRFFPGNYVADDLLTGVPSHAEMYTHNEKNVFLKYIQSRLDLIKMPNKDEAFLREKLLLMYANPVRNYERQSQKD